jgi:hypothetical protein
LQTDNADHLVGREEDITRLFQHCIEAQQIYLVGESGAGKTALLRAGVLPVLREYQTMLPIYLHLWGEDWVKGPQAALRDALWNSLSSEQREVLSLTECPPADKLMDIFKRIKPVLGRTPFIICDQFDDYQARHYDKFLPRRTKTWLSAKKLIAQNPFWADFKTLLEDQVIRCLFVTRNDTAIGLDAVRFTTTSVSYQLECPPYQLDLLRAEVVIPLLDKLAAESVISNPQRGWERLQMRLAKDLAQEGLVLPIQMRMAFLGLKKLKYLTVADYERAGGLVGLETGDLESDIANTARKFGLRQEQIRQLLLALVDEKTLKTQAQTTANLAKAMGIEANSEVFQKALHDLKRKEILRDRPDPDTRASVWILDHDYLCRAVLHAEQRANRWVALLREGEKVFEEAGHRLWRRWKALLTLGQQLTLVYQRVRGRFHYGPQRRYAFWSLGRWSPYMVAIVLGWWGTVNYLAWQQAKSLFEEIGIQASEELPHSEWDAVWTLAGSESRVKKYFINSAFTSAGSAERFIRRKEVLVQALVGINPEQRFSVEPVKDLVSLMQKTATEGKFDNKLLETLAFLSKQLQPGVRQKAVGEILPLIQKSTSVQEIEKLTRILVEIGQLDSDSAGQIASQALDLFTKDTDFRASENLSKILENLARDLDSQTVAQLASRALALLPKMTDLGQLDDLAKTLKVLGHLDSQTAAQVASQVLALLPKMTMTDSTSFDSLLKTLETQGVLDFQTTETITTTLLTMMLQTTGGLQVKNIAETLLAIPIKERQKIDSEVVKKVALHLLPKIHSWMSGGSLNYLGRGGDPNSLPILLAKKFLGYLDPQAAEQVSSLILSQMQNTTDLRELELLANILITIPNQQITEQVSSFLLSWLQKTTGVEQIEILTRSLKVLGRLDSQALKAQLLLLTLAVLHKMAYNREPDEFTKRLETLDSQTTDQLVSWALALLPEITDFWQLDSLFKILETLGRLDSQTATQLASRALDLLSRTDSQKVEAFLKTLDILVSHLDSQAAAQLASPVLNDLFKERFDSPRIEASIKTLEILASRIDSQTAAQLASQALALLPKMTNFDQLDRLTKTLEMLGYLDSQTSAQLASQVLTWLRETDSGEHIANSTRVLVILPYQLTPQVAEQIAAHLKEVMERTHSLGNIRGYSESLKLIADKISPQTLVNLLKMPFCIEDCPTVILNSLEQRSQQKFEGDRWKMVEWAKQQGLDVESLPVRPTVDWKPVTRDEVGSPTSNDYPRRRR